MTTNWPIWARPGWQGAKWGEGEAWAVASVTVSKSKNVIDEVWGDRSPNLDRALYKSTNMMALQVLAPEAEAGLLHGHQMKAVMAELQDRHQKEWRNRLEKRDWKKFDEDVRTQSVTRAQENTIRETCGVGRITSSSQKQRRHTAVTASARSAHPFCSHPLSK